MPKQKSEEIKTEQQTVNQSEAKTSDTSCSCPTVQKAKISWQQFILPNIHLDGWKFVGIAAAVSFILCFISGVLGTLGFLVALFIFYFFRDPERITPTDENLVIAPADGMVSAITVCPPPPELSMGNTPVVRISIFLSLFNVHVNRVPASGKIDKLVYVPGKFFNASLDKASKYNERQLVSMTASYQNLPLAFSQIAGLVARRIICGLDEGQEVKGGEKFGLIRFGSRMDVYLPAGVEALVVCGQETIAGETVIADMAVKSGRKGEIR